MGDQIRLAGAGDTTTWRTIVGVASDVTYGNPLSRDRGPDAIYLPLLQDDGPFAVVMARYRSTPSAGRAALIQAVGEADPLLVPDGVQPYAEVVRKAGFIALSVSKLFAACFGFALFLAVVGTYGLMSRSIGLRRGEIGIRRALGATEAGVRGLLLRQAARQLGRGAVLAAPVLAAVGVGFSYYFPIGVGLTVVLAVGVSLAIVAVVLATTWIPTRRAARVGLRESLTGG
ncbi:MAG: FtsX-like permease family protein [Gemmatimonadales bacterium]